MPCVVSHGRFFMLSPQQQSVFLWYKCSSKTSANKRRRVEEESFQDVPKRLIFYGWRWSKKAAFLHTTNICLSSREVTTGRPWWSSYNMLVFLRFLFLALCWKFHFHFMRHMQLSTASQVKEFITKMQHDPFFCHSPTLTIFIDISFLSSFAFLLSFF